MNGKCVNILSQPLLSAAEEYIALYYFPEEEGTTGDIPVGSYSEMSFDAEVPFEEIPDEEDEENVFGQVESPAPHSVGTSPAEPFWKETRKKSSSLEDAVSHLDESFQKRLLRIIDERGLSDAEVYRRADIDRKLFSKIRCSEDYTPRKRTILALVVALRLNADDARDLLGSADYTLSNSSKTDVIVSFCLENEVYDMIEVNALLDHFGEPTLN